MTTRHTKSIRRLIISTIVLLLVAGISEAHAQQFGPWSTPINLGATVNTGCADPNPALSKDGLTLIFASDRPTDNTVTGCLGAPAHLHLWVSERDCTDATDPACAWHAPVPLTMLNSPLEDNAPNFSTDGHWLFFHSSRPGGCNGANDGLFRELWATHRQNSRDDFGWEAPINLGCTLNQIGDSEFGPNFWEDDSNGTLYLYFGKDLIPPALDPNLNGGDIYVSTCTSDLASCIREQLWSPAEIVSELSSPVRDTRTAIQRRDGLEMFINSTRAGTVGARDLWVSTRASAQDPWSIPINLNQDNVNKGGDPVLNTSVNDGGPALSWDGQTLIFSSARAGGFGGPDLYMSTRQKLCDASATTSCAGSQ